MTWIGARGLDANHLDEVGASLNLQSAARRFKAPLKHYLDNMSKRYISFRKSRTADKLWYRKEEGRGASDLYGLELDVILLATLRAGNELLRNASIARDTNAPFWTPLLAIKNLYRNQILVDEVTDFSPLQIACMAALANPRLHSFFACGDFDQRLTNWGSRTIQEMQWAQPNLEVRKVNVAYRQSTQLKDLAQAILHAIGQVESNAILPRNMNNLGKPPTLLEHAAQPEQIAWLAQRIIEIENYLGQLPTIAIFVDSEELVSEVASTLGEALAGHSISVTVCANGQVIGQETEVRVFDVRYIKGLEFEAVFFLDIDKLAQQQPPLFDKYLYVGATRAATYLGLTCTAQLPPIIASLRPMFRANWQHQHE